MQHWKSCFFLQRLGDSGPFQLFTVRMCKLQQRVNGHDLKATIAGVDKILGPIWTDLDVQRENVVTEVVNSIARRIHVVL